MRRRAQRGSAIVEFALAGIATMVILISTFQLAWAMWNYHTMATMVHEGTRYAAVRGVGCTKAGNTCSVTIGNIATKLQQAGIGISSDSVNVTLTTDSGAATTCAPLNTCLTNTTTWPPSSSNDNRVGKLITISAAYRFRGALMFYWPGQGVTPFGEIWLPASSTQSIIF
jgi:hypothetical protein